MEHKLIYADELENKLIVQGFYPALVKSTLGKIKPVDAVEVVRCKECKNWKPFDEGGLRSTGRTDGTCGILVKIHNADRYMVESEHFCSYGDRRTEC